MKTLREVSRPWMLLSAAVAAPVYDSPQVVTIRATGTAKVLATVKAPKPYQTISFVLGTGQPDRWIVGLQQFKLVMLDNSRQLAKLYELTFDPATRLGNIIEPSIAW